MSNSIARRSAIAAALSVLLVGCASAPAARPSGDDRPNLVVILADDLGYSDLGSYGGEIRTPHLDRLARQGVRFSHFYNTGRCVPTRASLLTGLYSHQAGLGRMTTDQELPGYRGFLGRNAVTLAEVLRDAGYRTGMVGKWHVAETLARTDKQEQLDWLAHRADFGDFSPRDQLPTARGFEDYFGNLWGVVDFFDPFALVNGSEPVERVPEGYYHTDAITDTAIAYVDRYARGGRPFLLYVAHTAPHWPLHALPEDIERYRERYRDGWDAVREARYRGLAAEGIIDPAAAGLAPRVEPGARWADNPDREWDARAMAVHAAMVDRMDRSIGRLIARLEETGELDNTLILFLSDNGASPEEPQRFGPGFDRAGGTRDGRQVAFPVDKGVMPGPQETHAGIGPLWANAANTPFRWWKARMHEGGIATPMIAHWPRGGLRAGSIAREPGHVIDVMATALELAGARYPESYGDRPVTPLEGRSLLPVLRGGSRPSEPLYWEHFGARAVRDGDWKLVSEGPNRPWELYDLSRDRTELRDLAAAEPERMRRLESVWSAWADRAQVRPQP